MTDTEKYVVVIERDCWRQEDWPARDAAIAALRAVKKIRELLRVTDKLGDMIHPAELSELLP